MKHVMLVSLDYLPRGAGDLTTSRKIVTNEQLAHAWYASAWNNPFDAPFSNHCRRASSNVSPHIVSSKLLACSEKELANRQTQSCRVTWLTSRTSNRHVCSILRIRDHESGVHENHGAFSVSRRRHNQYALIQRCSLSYMAPFQP